MNTHRNCSGDNPCRRCLDGIDAAEEERHGHYRGWGERDLERGADRLADRYEQHMQERWP